LNDEPDVSGGDDKIDAGPPVWVDMFTSDEDSVEEEEVDESL
jgi:hypothetical protein